MSASTYLVILAATFFTNACGPMNQPPAGGIHAANVDAGTGDAEKNYTTKKKSYLIHGNFIGATIQDGELPTLPQGDDKYVVRAVHPDLSPLSASETINVQYFKVKQGEDAEVPPHQGANQAVLQPQADGSVVAILSFKKSAKLVTVMITINNSADPTLSDTKYVEVQVN